MRSNIVALCACLMVALLLAGEAVQATTFNCAAAPATPGDRRTDKSRLTVASWNTEWLFLSEAGRSNCPGSGCAWKDSDEAWAHLERVAEVLKEVDADVVTLLEVEDCFVLSELNKRVASLNYRYYLVPGTDTSTGQNAALLTRVDPVEDLTRTEARASYPVAGTKCGSGGSGSSGVSKHFITRLQVAPNTTVALIGAHLVAFPTMADRCLQREAQATVLAGVIADELAQGNEVMFMGDLNDYSAVVLDAAGDKPTSRALAIIADPVAATAGPELTNVAERIGTQSLRYSCWYDEDDDCADPGGAEHTMIDHMFLSAGLYANMVSAQYEHFYRVACGDLDSDHWPLRVEIDLSGSASGGVGGGDVDAGTQPRHHNDDDDDDDFRRGVVRAVLLSLLALVGLCGVVGFLTAMAVMAAVIIVRRNGRSREQTRLL